MVKNNTNSTKTLQNQTNIVYKFMCISRMPAEKQK